MSIKASGKESILILDNIRSTHNVGAIFRTADAAGITKIYLIGITPAPTDRFGRMRKDVAKAALGAEVTMPWESKPQITTVIKKLKKEGYTIVAIEQAANSIDYKKVRVTTKTAFIMGNEVDGIKPSTLKLCDFIAEIPMKGKKESLNVSVATGVALFRMLGI